jgi:hypothetical protein
MVLKQQAVLALLRAGPLTVRQIAAWANISDSSARAHVNRLRFKGKVQSTEKEGKWKVWSATPATPKPIDDEDELEQERLELLRMLTMRGIKNMELARTQVILPADAASFPLPGPPPFIPPPLIISQDSDAEQAAAIAKIAARNAWPDEEASPRSRNGKTASEKAKAIGQGHGPEIMAEIAEKIAKRREIVELQIEATESCLPLPSFSTGTCRQEWTRSTSRPIPAA